MKSEQSGTSSSENCGTGRDGSGTCGRRGSNGLKLWSQYNSPTQEGERHNRNRTIKPVGRNDETTGCRLGKAEGEATSFAYCDTAGQVVEEKEVIGMMKMDRDTGTPKQLRFIDGQ